MDAELRRLYSSMTAIELAERFGVRADALRQRAHRIGLKKEPPNKIRLDDRQKLWLRLNYIDMATEICAMYLGISVSSVKRIARRMGLRKTEQFMQEVYAHSLKCARESNRRNGTYPPKGYHSPNLQKGTAKLREKRLMSKQKRTMERDYGNQSF